MPPKNHPKKPPLVKRRSSKALTRGASNSQIIESLEEQDSTPLGGALKGDIGKITQYLQSPILLSIIANKIEAKERVATVKEARDYLANRNQFEEVHKLKSAVHAKLKSLSPPDSADDELKFSAKWLEYDPNKNKDYCDNLNRFRRKPDTAAPDASLFIAQLQKLTAQQDGFSLCGINLYSAGQDFNFLSDLFLLQTLTTKGEKSNLFRVDIKSTISLTSVKRLQKLVLQAKNVSELEECLAKTDTPIKQLIDNAIKFHKNKGEDKLPFGFWKYIVLAEIGLVENQVAKVNSKIKSTKSKHLENCTDPKEDGGKAIRRILFGDDESKIANEAEECSTAIRHSIAVPVIRCVEQVKALQSEGSLKMALRAPSITPFVSNFPSVIITEPLSSLQVDMLRGIDDAVWKSMENGDSLDDIFGKYDVVMPAGSGKSYVMNIVQKAYKSLFKNGIHNFDLNSSADDLKKVFDKKNAANNKGRLVILDELFFYPTSKNFDFIFERYGQGLEKSEANFERVMAKAVREIRQQGATVIFSGASKSTSKTRVEIARLERKVTKKAKKAKEEKDAIDGDKKEKEAWEAVHAFYNKFFLLDNHFVAREHFGVDKGGDIGQFAKAANLFLEQMKSLITTEFAQVEIPGFTLNNLLSQIFSVESKVDGLSGEGTAKYQQIWKELDQVVLQFNKTIRSNCIDKVFAKGTGATGENKKILEPYRYSGDVLLAAIDQRIKIFKGVKVSGKLLELQKIEDKKNVREEQLANLLSERRTAITKVEKATIELKKVEAKAGADFKNRGLHEVITEGIVELKAGKKVEYILPNYEIRDVKGGAEADIKKDQKALNDELSNQLLAVQKNTNADIIIAPAKIKDAVDGSQKLGYYIFRRRVDDKVDNTEATEVGEVDSKFELLGPMDRNAFCVKGGHVNYLDQTLNVKYSSDKKSPPSVLTIYTRDPCLVTGGDYDRASVLAAGDEQVFHFKGDDDQLSKLNWDNFVQLTRRDRGNAEQVGDGEVALKIIIEAQKIDEVELEQDNARRLLIAKTNKNTIEHDKDCARAYLEIKIAALKEDEKGESSKCKFYEQQLADLNDKVLTDDDARRDYGIATADQSLVMGILPEVSVTKPTKELTSEFALSDLESALGVIRESSSSRPITRSVSRTSLLHSRRNSVITSPKKSPPPKVDSPEAAGVKTTLDAIPEADDTTQTFGAIPEADDTTQTLDAATRVVKKKKNEAAGGDSIMDEDDNDADEEDNSDDDKELITDGGADDDNVGDDIIVSKGGHDFAPQGAVDEFAKGGDDGKGANEVSGEGGSDGYASDFESSSEESSTAESSSEESSSEEEEVEVDFETQLERAADLIFKNDKIKSEGGYRDVRYNEQTGKSLVVSEEEYKKGEKNQVFKAFLSAYLEIKLNIIDRPDKDKKENKTFFDSLDLTKKEALFSMICHDDLSDDQFVNLCNSKDFSEKIDGNDKMVSSFFEDVLDTLANKGYESKFIEWAEQKQQENNYKEPSNSPSSISAKDLLGQPQSLVITREISKLGVSKKIKLMKEMSEGGSR